MTAEDSERELRRLWGSYAYLRDYDLSEVSTTSRLLHEADTPYLRSRLSEELEELAGALSGTHRHAGLRQDVVLEGSQVCYWVYLISLCLGISYNLLAPHEHLMSTLDKTTRTKARRSERGPVRAIAEQLRELAGRIATAEESDVLPPLQ